MGDQDDVFPSTEDTNDDILDKLKVNEIDTITELINLLGPLNLDENNNNTALHTTTTMTASSSSSPSSIANTVGVSFSISQSSNPLESNTTDGSLFWPTKEAHNQFIQMKERSKLFIQGYETDIQNDENFVPFTVAYDNSDIPSFPTEEMNNNNKGNDTLNGMSTIGTTGSSRQKQNEHLDDTLMGEYNNRTARNMDDSEEEDNTATGTPNISTYCGSSSASDDDSHVNEYSSKDKYVSNIMYGNHTKNSSSWFQPSCTEEEAVADIQKLLGITQGTNTHTTTSMTIVSSSNPLTSDTSTTLRSTVTREKDNRIDDDDDI